MEVIETDYLILGAGTAGCVLADRLTEGGRDRVLLAEAGESDWHPYIHVPAAFMKTFAHPLVNWCFETAPSEGSDGRAVFFPRGKGLGGSSSINGLLHVRGQAADFDGWAQLGNRGWGYADILPYFRRSEDRAGGGDGYRGEGGPLHISDVHERHPLCEAFIDGVEAMGIPRNLDYNGKTQAGVAYYQRTIRRGRRQSAARTFLARARRRPTLRIETHALATQLVLEDRCVAGARLRQHGREVEVRARREVILCLGAIGSPQLLQVSGIGSEELLRRLEVPIRHRLDGVGEGFQDHYSIRSSRRVAGIVTLNERARGGRLLAEIGNWLLTGSGLLGFSPAHVGVFWKSDPALDLPDLQFVFTPASYVDGAIGKLEPHPAMTCGVWQMRPESRGWLHARTPDMADMPEIQPNYLREETDRRVITKGLAMARRFLATKALAPWAREESQPGPACDGEDALLDYARAKGGTVFHAIGSCRMGADGMAVVDDRLRIHGLRGIRVADASIMPTMPSANTNAATLMIAEKASDMILEDARRDA